MQVVERSPRCPQPVLEHRDVARVRLRRVQRTHRRDGEGQVALVLVRGQGARAGELVGVVRTVHQVPSRHDDVVRPGEQVDGLGQPLRLRLRCPDARQPGDGRPAREHVEDVRPAGRVGRVGRGAREQLRRGLVAVVGPPVLHREDLVQVGHPAQLGDRVEEACRRQVLKHLGTVRREHQPRLLRRRLQVALLAERAVPAALRRVDRHPLGVGNGVRPLAPPGNGPHHRPGERRDLLDGPVREPHERLAAVPTPVHARASWNDRDAMSSTATP